MSFGKLALRCVLLINLIYWGWMIVSWDWLGFQNQSSIIETGTYIGKFLRWNIEQFIVTAVWIAGLIGLFSSPLARNINLILSAIFFGVMVMMDWGEYRHDKALALDGNIRGALDSLRMSAFFLTANLWALGYVFFTKFKTRK